MDEFLELLTLEDLSGEQLELAECIGLEAYKKLLATYAGLPITVRMPDRVTLGVRNAKIIDEFNGYNFSRLASKYRLSESSIRKIVANKKSSERTKPDLDSDSCQITFFSE